MTGWVEVMIVAFGAQLAVLPGEKVQFIIAALSTRYAPLLVVAAAGSAFAGWTALEILLGNALRGALPGVYLDLVTAGLFLLFGAMLYRSAPEEAGPAGEPAGADGGFGATVDEYDLAVAPWLPDSLGTFLGVFSLMAVGEVGDKTQLVTIGLALQYGATSAIWVGEMLAILPVSLANALVFYRFAHRLNLRKAHLVAAAVFAFFAFDTLLSVAAGVSLWETAVGTVARWVAGFA